MQSLTLHFKVLSMKEVSKSDSKIRFWHKLIPYLPFISFLAFIVWMIVQENMNQENMISHAGHSVPHGDKIGHFLLFGLLALLLNIALRFKVVDLSFRRFHLGSILVFSLAILEEFSQLAFDTRTFDLFDMLFDLFGIGLLSSISFRKFFIKKLRSSVNHLSKRLQVD